MALKKSTAKSANKAFYQKFGVTEEQTEGVLLVYPSAIPCSAKFRWDKKYNPLVGRRADIGFKSGDLNQRGILVGIAEVSGANFALHFHALEG